MNPIYIEARGKNACRFIDIALDSMNRGDCQDAIEMLDQAIVDIERMKKALKEP